MAEVYPNDYVDGLVRERDAIAAKADEARDAAVALSLKLGAAEDRISALEADYALLVAEHEKTEAELAARTQLLTGSVHRESSVRSRALRAESRIGTLEAALRAAHCPYPFRDNRDQVVGFCVDRDQCGCAMKAALTAQETPAEWGCSQTTNNGDRCVLPAGHDGSHSL